MKYSDFKNQLNDGTVFPVYLLEGEDAFFRKRALEVIVSTLVTESELNYVSFAGDSLDFDSFLSSIEMLPFMSKKRVTSVSEFYPDKNKLEKLKVFLSNPPSDSVLVIINEKAFEPIKKYDCVCVVDCGKADPVIIKKWIKATCSKNGVDITEKALNNIVEYCLCDMTRIESEVNKVCAFVGENGLIDEDVTDALVAKDTEYKIYEMTDCIGRKKFSDAINIVNEMLSKGEAEQRLLVSLYNYFSRLLHVSLSDKPDLETASLLGIKEYAVKKTKEQARLFKVTSLKNAVDILSNEDYSFKTGRIDVDDAFWLSLFKIMVKG